MDSVKVAGTPFESLISICIPTYKRPDLLAAALNSCLAQTWHSLEIVIGDDSPDDATEQLVARYQQENPGLLRYQHHKPSLGQNRNVNDLFIRATGSRLILLHDDDLLLPGAVERLALLWNTLPTLDAAFGKQALIEHDGSPVASERTEELNTGYHRTSANAGRQPIPIVAGLLRMFPNDGFMVSTALARQIGYRSVQEVGDACDTDFGIRLCAAAHDVWFLDEFTVQYRLSAESISKYSTVDPYTYRMLSSLTVASSAEPILAAARREIAQGAVSGFARLGRTSEAWRLFCSPDYPIRQRLGVRGLYHLLLIAVSAFTRN